jgi:hypothetical protein
MSEHPVVETKKEQRLAARKLLRSHGTLVLDGHEPLPFDAVDVAPDGMGIALSRQLTAGQRCRIDFALLVNGRRRDVAVMAKVTHCVLGRDGFKAGLQFLKMLDEASGAALAQFMLG